MLLRFTRSERNYSKTMASRHYLAIVRIPSNAKFPPNIIEFLLVTPRDSNLGEIDKGRISDFAEWRERCGGFTRNRWWRGRRDTDRETGRDKDAFYLVGNSMEMSFAGVIRSFVIIVNALFRDCRFAAVTRALELFAAAVAACIRQSRWYRPRAALVISVLLSYFRN